MYKRLHTKRSSYYCQNPTSLFNLHVEAPLSSLKKEDFWNTLSPISFLMFNIRPTDYKSIEFEIRKTSKWLKWRKILIDNLSRIRAKFLNYFFRFSWLVAKIDQWCININIVLFCQKTFSLLQKKSQRPPSYVFRIHLLQSDWKIRHLIKYAFKFQNRFFFVK